MLTGAQLEHYRDRGYVIPDFRLPEAVVEDLRADQARLVTRHPELRQYCPNLLHYDLRFLEIARTPEIVAMVGQLLGPDLALWNSSLFAKPATDGKRTPWHQDGQYWPIRPLATCTVWIALDDSTTENGCLRVIPGSHHGQKLRAHQKLEGDDATLNQELLASEYDESKAADLVLQAGPDVAARCFPAARLRAQLLSASAAWHDAALHADHVGVRSGHRARPG